MESNYGEILKNDKVMRNVVRSLATLAYADKRRAKFARTQLIAALKILQTGDIDESHLTGSWAGAMGHTQFIPTSYQAYAVDVDGNGRRDIWNSIPDALATASQPAAQERLAGRQDLGLRGRAPGRQEISQRLDVAGEMAGHRRDARQRQAVQERRRQGRAEGAGRPRRPGLPDDQEFLASSRPTTTPTNMRLPSAFLPTRSPAMVVWCSDWNRPFTKLSFEEKQELAEAAVDASATMTARSTARSAKARKAAIKAFQAQAGLDAGRPSQHGSPEIAQGELGGEQVQARTSISRQAEAGGHCLRWCSSCSPAVSQCCPGRAWHRSRTRVRAPCWTSCFAVAATTSSHRR